MGMNPRPSWKPTLASLGNVIPAKALCPLLDDHVEHAPEGYRELMLKNVQFHSEIEGAWKALHPEQGSPEGAERVEGAKAVEGHGNEGKNS